MLHAHTRVHPVSRSARCPSVCTRLSSRPAAAPPALQALVYQSLHAARIAFESAPAPAAAPAARHPAPVLAVPCGAGLWPAGGLRGWPAAGVGRLRPAPVLAAGCGRLTAAGAFRRGPPGRALHHGARPLQGRAARWSAWRPPGAVPPQRPRRRAWPRPLIWLPGTRGTRLSPLIAIARGG
jgi:hypothetical protein